MLRLRASKPLTVLQAIVIEESSRMDDFITTCRSRQKSISVLMLSAPMGR